MSAEVLEFPNSRVKGESEYDKDAASRIASEPDFQVWFSLPSWILCGLAILFGALLFLVSCGVFGPPIHRVEMQIILLGAFLISVMLYIATRVLRL